MPIRLASDKPEVQQQDFRANFRWSLTEPWDERRLAAFLMTKHRRSDADWTRRTSPFYAGLGMAAIECSVPIAGSNALPELEAVLTRELKGILAAASQVHDEMIGEKDWREVIPPSGMG